MRRAAGFTIVELLVTVSIVAILAALAVPSYYHMIARVHRAEATGLLSELYAMEQAFFGEKRRYGCLDEVGFQIEGKGHFAVWICDDGSGCYLEPDGGIRCPCLEAPDDWTGPGGDPFVRLDGGEPATRYAWAPLPLGGGGPFLAGAGPPAYFTVSLLAVTPPPDYTPPPAGDGGTPYTPPAPSDPGGIPVPLDLPVDCATVMASPIFTGGADNWCARAIPDVVDVFWMTSTEGKQVNRDSYPEVSGSMGACVGEPAPPGP